MVLFIGGCAVQLMGRFFDPGGIESKVGCDEPITPPRWQRRKRDARFRAGVVAALAAGRENRGRKSRAKGIFRVLTVYARRAAA